MNFLVRTLGKWFAGRTIAGVQWIEITGIAVHLEFRTAKHSPSTHAQNAPSNYFYVLLMGSLLVYVSYLSGHFTYFLQNVLLYILFG